MRKSVWLASKLICVASQEGKSLPIHEYAIMVATVATKHTLRQCGGRSTVVTLRILRGSTFP